MKGEEMSDGKTAKRERREVAKKEAPAGQFRAPSCSNEEWEFAKRCKRDRKFPEWQVKTNGQTYTIESENASDDEKRGDDLFETLKALGVTDLRLALELMTDAAEITKRDGEPKTESLNKALSIIRGVEPRNAVEALLASQMAAIHMATIRLARQFNHSSVIEQQAHASNALNKLARTFAAQMDALKRYRSLGDQTVRVEHVTVNEGGQAIVGAVTHPGGRSQK